MKGMKIFYSLVTGPQTLRPMKDILGQNQLSGTEGTTSPDCPCPASPVAIPTLPMTQDPISAQPGAPRPGWSYAGGLLVSSLASWMDLRPMLQSFLQPCLCFHPFLLQSGSPGWTLTLVLHLLCLGLLTDPDISLMCSDLWDSTRW